MVSRPESTFSLDEGLKRVANILPRQAPIRDFIHQSALQVFLPMPFDEAVMHAANLYGAQCYMDLAFYRQRYRDGYVTDESLIFAIKQSGLTATEEEFQLLKHALFTYVTIKDESQFQFVAKRQGITRSEQLAVLAKVSRHGNTSRPQTFRTLLNQQLGIKSEHFIHRVLFRLLGAYLDQGVSLWPYLHKATSFIDGVKGLAQASALPIAEFVNNRTFVDLELLDIDRIIIDRLTYLLVSQDLFLGYLTETLLEHPGWSGMVNVISEKPKSLAQVKHISLKQMLLVKLVLETELIRFQGCAFRRLNNPEVRVDNGCGEEELSLAWWILGAERQLSVQNHDFALRIRRSSLQKIWHEALEQSYYRQAMATFTMAGAAKHRARPRFQGIFCLDDRECSLRRHLEAVSEDCETFGTPGFFAVDSYFQAYRLDTLEKICPVSITPKHVITEEGRGGRRGYGHGRIRDYTSVLMRHHANTMLGGFVSAYTLGHLSLFQLIASFFHPLRLVAKNQHRNKASLRVERPEHEGMKNGLFYGYCPEEMAERVFSVLTMVGLTKNFAKLVAFVGHGSSSVNNPHAAAYDCAACSGRPGVTNARAAAFMANHPKVRALLKERGIAIPEETIFVGIAHDTCSEDIGFYDCEDLSCEQAMVVQEFKNVLERARRKNAQERCERFALAKVGLSENQAIAEVQHRSRALFEARPELGHTDNALCVIARRMRSRDLDLQRRAFLQSYDPHHDPDGRILQAILTAAIPVCGGVNLDYFFSKVDPAIYGCGTKLSHNVCGLIGVGNGLDDDLRTGLPVQMTELHDPVRLLFIIEQAKEVIINSISTHPDLLPWVKNAWVKVAALDPNSNHVEMIDASAWNQVPPC